MYASNDYASYQQGHRFNPNAPAFAYGAGYGADGASYHPQQQQGAPADFTPYPMSAAALAEQQQQHHAHAGAGTAEHQTSFGSASNNTSFSGPSTPAMSGSNPSNTKQSRRRHNPYASSNASTSEPSTPVVGPAVASARVPAADGSFFSAHSSANTSSVQSPVYAQDVATGYTDAANNHPIAFTINEQFAQARGTLAQAACTPRGRHMLVGALRQQHTDKIQAIFEELAPNVGAVVMDAQGGHVVRTMIEFLNEAQVAALVDFLTPELVLTIATSSQNTRRVLQTLFERHRTPALQPVVDVIATHAIALATTQQGCIAVMRCMEHSPDLHKAQVLQALQPQLAALTMDPYGNYVVQAVLQYFPNDVACEVLEKAFAGHWVALSCNKFASNVMEKFIQASPPMTRKTILDELVHTPDALNTLMQDGFGNFVLQQIIDTCTTGTEYRKMSEKIRPMLAVSPFGHKIEAKLKSKRFGPPYESTGATAGPNARESANNANRQAGNNAGGRKNEGRRGKAKQPTDGSITGADSHKDTASSRSGSNRSVSDNGSANVVTAQA